MLTYFVKGRGVFQKTCSVIASPVACGRSEVIQVVACAWIASLRSQ
ncbi:MAG: hypothetical protein LBJ47_04125 [Tannerella sp.]|nr:hypothetical protein [Tannerella sp.]